MSLCFVISIPPSSPPPPRLNSRERPECHASNKSQLNIQYFSHKKKKNLNSTLGSGSTAVYLTVAGRIVLISNISKKGVCFPLKKNEDYAYILIKEQYLCLVNTLASTKFCEMLRAFTFKNWYCIIHLCEELINFTISQWTTSNLATVLWASACAFQSRNSL